MRVTWTPDMDAALVEMRSKGFGQRATGDLIGVCGALVRDRERELGIAVAKPRHRPRLDVDRSQLAEALRSNQWARAAHSLGVSERTARRRAKEYGISRSAQQ